MRLTERELRRLIRQEADRLIRESSSDSIHRANIDEGFLDKIKGMFGKGKSNKSPAPSGESGDTKGPSLESSGDILLKIINQAANVGFSSDPKKDESLENEIKLSLQPKSVINNLAEEIREIYGKIFDGLESGIYKESDESYVKSVGIYIAITTAVLNKEALPEVQQALRQERDRRSGVSDTGTTASRAFFEYVEKVRNLATAAAGGDLRRLFNRIKIWDIWGNSGGRDMPIILNGGRSYSLAHFIFAPGSGITTPIGLRSQEEVFELYAALKEAFLNDDKKKDDIENIKIMNMMIEIFNGKNSKNATISGFQNFLNKEISSGAGAGIISYINQLLTSDDFPSVADMIKGIRDAIPAYNPDEPKKSREKMMGESFDLERWNKLAGILKG